MNSVKNIATRCALRYTTQHSYTRKKESKETIYCNNQKIPFGRIISGVTSLYENLSFSCKRHRHLSRHM